MARHGRIEDVRLLSGRGRYTADLVPEGALHAAFLRAPIARGRLVQIDTSAAAEAPGVAAVFTAADLATDGLTELPFDIAPARDDGGKVQPAARPILSGGAIRHLGEPVAMVVAASRALAEDAAELIEAEFATEGHAVTDTLAPAQDPVWEGADDNIAELRRVGNRAAADAAFAGAAHVAEITFDISRIAANPLEPRTATGRVDADGRLELVTATQSPFAIRASLATVFGCAPDAIRVFAPDVGGSFGMKGGLFREEVLVLWAARRLGRPVAWCATRSESFLADDHGRSVKGRARLALDAEGNFLALDTAITVDVGAYFGRRSRGMLNNLGGIAGTYRIGAIAAEVAFAFTNSVPTCPYRGFGRPEATYILETLIDRAARDTGRDRFALRRQNLVTPAEMPYKTALTFHYDCGDFPRVFDRALALADTEGFTARRAESATRGRLRGLGLSMPIEVAGGPLRELKKDVARVTLRADGKVELSPGCMSVGQGHETTLARLLADRLGLDAGSIVYLQGDTDLLPSGRGNGGSAATVVAGAAVAQAAGDVLSVARELAAEALEAEAETLDFAGGIFTAKGTNRSISLSELAARAGGSGISALSEFLPPNVTYPNGCHLAEVEIDPETGALTLCAYTGVEDVGTVLNPPLVEGQMLGGIAQGIGQAIGEEIVFDDSGQILSGSFMDYRMPRAADMPAIALDTVEVPTAVNPLGAKGVGEAGTVGALAAVMNAVRDALHARGIEHFEMPATPDRLWRALRDAT